MMALSLEAPALAQSAASSLIFASRVSSDGCPPLKTQSLCCFHNIHGTRRVMVPRPLRMGVGTDCCNIAKWRKHPTKRRGSTNRLACGRVRFSARHDRRRDAALSRWHGRHECLSSWRRWYCGPCRWGSRSARGATASWRPLPLASPSSRPPHNRPRRRIPRPALRQHRCPAPPLLSHFRLSYLCSAVPMAYKGHENMFQHEELVGSSWIGAYSALCFSCGHDAYGQLDMLRYRLYSGWIPGILMHHLILLICFTLALYRNVTINYLILTLLCEMHSIFLHVRKLRRMAGFRDFNRKLVKLEWVLNWTTFVTARVICHILITYRLITDAHKFDKGIELPLALSGMAGMNLLNVSLGIDLCKAFARERNQQTHQD